MDNRKTCNGEQSVTCRIIVTNNFPLSSVTGGAHVIVWCLHTPSLQHNVSRLQPASHSTRGCSTMNASRNSSDRRTRSSLLHSLLLDSQSSKDWFFSASWSPNAHARKHVTSPFRRRPRPCITSIALLVISPDRSWTDVCMIVTNNSIRYRSTWKIGKTTTHIWRLWRWDNSDQWGMKKAWIVLKRKWK